MTRFRTILIMVAAAAALSLGAAMPAFAAPLPTDCLTDQEVAAAIASGQIQKWAVIRMLAGVPKDYKEKSTIRVCRLGGVPYFVVNMVSPKGDFNQYVFNAVDGTAEVL